MTVELLGAAPLASDRLARPLSPAVRAGDFVFVSGQVPTDDAGQVVVGGIEAQTRQVFKNLESALALAGCTLEDVCTAAAFLCRTGGSFYIVHKPERLAELMCCMSAHGLEPKRMRMVCHTAGAAPNLLLVEGRRGAKPGMRIEPALILREADGSETEEIRRIYHR